ncbi:MAG: hypothetical protein NHB14_20430 [Desulfosporosinus sp.]|nr:hypothetical protein [Desulfosporosinus sp.]
MVNKESQSVRLLFMGLSIVLAGAGLIWGTILTYRGGTGLKQDFNYLLKQERDFHLRGNWMD